MQARKSPLGFFDCRRALVMLPEKRRANLWQQLEGNTDAPKNRIPKEK